MSVGLQFIKSLKSVLMGRFNGNVSEMARETGIHRNQLDRYLSGANSPTLETLEALAKALAQNPVEMLMNDAQRARWDSIKPASPQVRLSEAAKALDSKTAEYLLGIIEAAESAPADSKKSG